MRSALVSLVIAGCLALQALPAAAQASSQPVLDRIRASGRIMLAHRESSVPFSFVNHGRPMGYAIDLCLRAADAVRRSLGLQRLDIGFVPVTSESRLAAIVGGQADLECGSTTNNAERRQQVAFAIPYYITGARYLVRSDSPITELAQFENRKLVSTKGSTALRAVTRANDERLLRIKILEASDHAHALEMVAKGDADGFAMDDVLLFGLLATHAHPERFKVVGKFLNIEPLAIMLSKDDPALKRIVDDELKRIIRSREAHDIYERWFARPIPPHHTALNLPMPYLLKDLWKYPTDVMWF